MSIKIDESRCVGCARCVEVCPGNLIKIDAGLNGEKRAVIKHERDCWGCTSCVKACPKTAIRFFLGADIGGRGALLTVQTSGAVRVWRVEKSGGECVEIAVDARESNKY